MLKRFSHFYSKETIFLLTYNTFAVENKAEGA